MFYKFNLTFYREGVTCKRLRYPGKPILSLKTKYIIWKSVKNSKDVILHALNAQPIMTLIILNCVPPIPYNAIYFVLQFSIIIENWFFPPTLTHTSFKRKKMLQVKATCFHEMPVFLSLFFVLSLSWEPLSCVDGFLNCWLFACKLDRKCEVHSCASRLSLRPCLSDFLNLTLAFCGSCRLEEIF